MLWEEWLASIAPSLNVTTGQAGVIMALIFTIGFMLMALIASPEHANYGVPLSCLFSVILFTYVEWYPRWTGAALGLTLSILMAIVFSSGGQQKRT